MAEPVEVGGLGDKADGASECSKDRAEAPPAAPQNRNGRPRREEAKRRRALRAAQHFDESLVPAMLEKISLVLREGDVAPGVVVQLLQSARDLRALLPEAEPASGISPELEARLTKAEAMLEVLERCLPEARPDTRPGLILLKRDGDAPSA